MNLANKLTMLRVVMIPAFVIVLYADFEGCRYVALALFAIASFTDFLDGYIARSRNLVTDFGKFRELAVSGLRMIAATEGKVIAAAWSGKVKTASTMVCILLMLLPIPPVLNTVCWVIILATTVYSGVEYFTKNKHVIDWSNL